MYEIDPGLFRQITKVAAGVQTCLEWASRLKAAHGSQTKPRTCTSQTATRLLRRLFASASQVVTIACLVVSLLAAPAGPMDSFSYTNPLFGNIALAGQWVGGSAVDWDHAWLEVHR
jgi:hypothetical protein